MTGLVPETGRWIIPGLTSQIDPKPPFPYTDLPATVSLMLRFCVENFMQRRDFIALLGGVFSWPFLAHAQQKAMPVIGQLSVFSPTANLGDLLRGPVHQGLSEMGFVE